MYTATEIEAKMIYKIQIDNQVRDVTPEEAIAIQTRENDSAAQAAALEASSAAKTSARAKLKALGLTDIEIAALVG